MSATVCTIKKVSNGFVITTDKTDFVVEGDEKKLVEFISESLESPICNSLKDGEVKMFIDIKPFISVH